MKLQHLSCKYACGRDVYHLYYVPVLTCTMIGLPVLWLAHLYYDWFGVLELLRWRITVTWQSLNEHQFHMYTSIELSRLHTPKPHLCITIWSSHLLNTVHVTMHNSTQLCTCWTCSCQEHPRALAWCSVQPHLLGLYLCAKSTWCILVAEQTTSNFELICCTEVQSLSPLSIRRHTLSRPIDLFSVSEWVSEWVIE